MRIPPTLTLDDAASRTWDVVVVGAGPAGALAAHEVARRGVPVLLVDRAEFPRSKVCGCCINGRALAVLQAAGLGELLTTCGAVPLTTVILAAGGQSARLPLTGMVLSREAFDAAVVHAAIRAGAGFLPGTHALLRASGKLQCLHLQQAGRTAEIHARVILAADGLGGGFLLRASETSLPAPGSRIGAGVVMESGPDFYRRGVVYMACGREGYVGVVQLEDGRLDVAAALDLAAVRRAGSPGTVVATILAQTGWPALEGVADAPWRGTAALTRHMHRPGIEGVFALGDAAGFVEPFTGEGISWALASGLAVTPLALRAVGGWHPSLLHEWETVHRRIVRDRQRACRTAAFILRRPRLVAGIVHLLCWLPCLSAPVLRALNSRRGLHRQAGTSG
jgi:flavin-dependent dehydrogenase